MFRNNRLYQILLANKNILHSVAYIFTTKIKENLVKTKNIIFLLKSISID